MTSEQDPMKIQGVKLKMLPRAAVSNKILGLTIDSHLDVSEHLREVEGESKPGPHVRQRSRIMSFSFRLARVPSIRF